MPDFSVQGGVKENNIRLATRFHNRENGAYALLSTVSTVQTDSVSGRPQLRIRFSPSTFTSNGQMWGLGAREILCDSAFVAIDGFRMVSGQQRLMIDGVISHNLADTLKMQLHNFDLTPSHKSQIGADTASVALPTVLQRWLRQWGVVFCMPISHLTV